MIENEIKGKEPSELYGMQFDIKVPCEIRINDIVISKNYLSGVVGPEILNQYIKRSGEQKVSIKVLHPYILEGGLFNDDALKSIIEGTYVQTIEPKNDYAVKVIKELKFPLIKEEVPSFEYEWTFDAKIPYAITSWDDAQNLKNIDKEELRKEVTEKYRQLWYILQSGNVDEFIKEISDANNDLFMSNYFDKEKMDEYLRNLRVFYSNHKGAMVPIDNSEIVLLAEGKGVALEQVGRFKGFGLLMAKGSIENSLYTNYIVLVKSQKTNKFKVQMINSEFVKYK